MIEAILNRRSIRRYRPEPVPRAQIEAVLRAGMLAPSSKNRQPWRFVVADGDAKAEALACMERGLERERIRPLLPESAAYLDGAAQTLRVMRSAPVIVFVVSELAEEIGAPLSVDARVAEVCNAQSIGAAIENMTLAATELGLGSLWICDTFFAQRELCGWLMTEGTLYAALALGYPAEAPAARPRKPFGSAVTWRSEAVSAEPSGKSQQQENARRLS